MITINDIPKIRQKEIKIMKKEPITLDSKIINDLWDNLIDQGNIRDNNTLIPREYQGINQAWAGQPCFIIGTGKALTPIWNKVGLDWLKNKHSIGINHIIEDYDGFEWFLFLDQAFLDRTPYDMNKYQGLIFASNKCNIEHGGNKVIFKIRSNGPGHNREEGLYNGNLSGLCALNLAIIAGAKPIYLLGFGNGIDGNFKDYHYKKQYRHVDNSEKKFNKYKGAYGYFETFRSYNADIYHVTDGCDISQFKKMRTQQFMNKFCKDIPIKIIGRQPVICHLSFSNDINVHAEQTRGCFNHGYGKHIIINVNKEAIPNADFYIYEHFISTKVKEKEFRYKHKAVDIVHTCNCIPTGNWHKIVALTNYWKRFLLKTIPGEKIEVIPAGINLDDYKDIQIDYTSKVFGRITRYSTGKINQSWNQTIKEILDSIPDSKCIMYTQLDNTNERPILQHERMIYDKSVKIFDFKGNALSKLSLYIHANGFFKEICSLALIEAMACGLPIVYLYEESIADQLGPAGIACLNMKEFKFKIIELLNDPYKRKYYGGIAKERSKLYHVNKFIEGIDKIVKERLN